MPNLLSNIDSNEDASVYLITEDIALVQTLDFITPVVDDPYIFGQIAAANSLSDIFAMGGEVINALNIVGFDDCNFSQEILFEILAGGKNKVKECGGVLVGGHSITTSQMYYGLSVTGKVAPNKFWSNNTAKIGDLLILTKPLGGGILSTAIKADMISENELKEIVELMRMLNYYAVGALSDLKISACTDITGFGFLGHAVEMVRDEISFEIYTSQIPILKSAQKYAQMGLIPEGSYKNLDFISKSVNLTPDISLCDAQTSGGLLFAIDEADANLSLQRLKDCGYEQSSVVGRVIPKDQHKINLN